MEAASVEMLPKNRDHPRLRDVPPQAHSSCNAELPLRLCEHSVESLEVPLRLERLVEPLLVPAGLGFEQHALLWLIAVVLHALAVTADLVAPALGGARHLGLVDPGLLGH